MPKVFIFIGRSGSGKGTQAKLLIDYLKKETPENDSFYMYTGDEFRKFIQGESFAKHLSKEIYEAGGRQPDFLAIYMWARVITERFKGTEHLVFDGTPRSLLEAQALDSALEFLKSGKAYVIHIDVSREWSLERLLGRGREDDTRHEIDKRLAWYDKDVSPAVEYYQNNPQYVYCKINGEQTIENVHRAIISKINS